MSDSNTEEEPKRTPKSLADLSSTKAHGSVTKALLKATEVEAERRTRANERADFSSFLPPPINPFHQLPEQKPQTYSLRHERIKQLPDEELMQYLTRERVPKDGVLDDGAKMAITMELMRRQSQRLEPASWWRDRNYLTALVAAVCGTIATVLVSWDFFSK